MGWKEDAAISYFEDGKSISDISDMTGISRQSISAYLKTLPGYQDERERRKARNQERRKEYKREKNREYRSSLPMAPTAESIRHEHEMAVRILSQEKY